MRKDDLLAHLDEIHQALSSAPSEPTEKCNDGGEHEFTTVMHTDSADSYTWLFKCKKCKEYVKKTQKRKGRDKAYWS